MILFFVLGGLAVSSALLVVNLIFFRRLPKAGNLPFSLPDGLSVLIPARNEEKKIRQCLHSLLSQTLSPEEILVLDDGSTDQTSQIVQQLASTSKVPIRLISGLPLPPNWVGKCWACHQLSEKARGKWFLFLDADTSAAPDLVERLLCFAHSGAWDMVSVWPRQITKTWSEKWVIPLGYLLFLNLMPLFLGEWLRRSPRLASFLSAGFLRGMGVANGQCLLFCRDSYRKLGGHQSVAGHLVEDVALGRLATVSSAAGFRSTNRDGSDVIQCRMYDGFSSLWEGFSKNLRPVYEKDLGSFFITGAVLISLFLLPFGMALGKPCPLSLLACLWILAIRFVHVIRFRTSASGAFLHPLGLILALLIAANSWRLWATGGVSWKGRSYDRQNSMKSV